MALDSPVDRRWAKFIQEHRVPPKENGVPFTFDETDAIMNRNLKDGQLPGPEDVEVIDTRTEHISVRIYLPPKESRTSQMPCFMYFHGGGFTYLSVATFDPIQRKMCKAGKCVVVAPEYTVTRSDKDPSTKFPKAVNESYDAFLWTVKNASTYGIDPKRIFVGGGSCGANFATVICLMARDNQLDIKPRGQILLSPFLNPNCDTPSWFKYGRGGYNNNREGALIAWTNYMRGPEDELNPYCCPLRAKDLSNLPKTLIIQGEIDPITDEGNVYAQLLKRSGVDVVVTIYQGNGQSLYLILNRYAARTPITRCDISTECKLALASVAAFIQE